MLKHAKPNYKKVCNDFLDDLKLKNEKRTFMPQMSRTGLTSLYSVNDVFEIYSNRCSHDELIKRHEPVEITWRYQFLESPHCIVVDLDLGNLTRFRQQLAYDYYMFSYRELGHENLHLKRNPIEQVNRLLLHRVNIKPYIVCVSFYRAHLLENQTTYTNDTDKNCNEMNAFLARDDRMHDVDLCVDIDTPTHFLSHVIDEERSFSSFANPELLMVIFIMCLLVLLLVLITFIHYLIERPKKKRKMEFIREYLRRKNPGATNSNLGSHGSLNKDKVGLNVKDSTPAIMISDYSSMNSSTHQLHDEARETDSLLPASPANIVYAFGSHSSPSQASAAAAGSANSKYDFGSGSAPMQSHDYHAGAGFHRATFHIGETIIEESPSSVEMKYLDQANSTTDGGAVDASAEENGQNDEAVKTISHLLDDKPWSSQTISNSRRESKSQLNNTNQNGTNVE